MILHYLKVALRNLLKYPTHSIISVICLAVGIAFFTLVSHFVGKVATRENFPRAEEEIRFIPTRESAANFFHWQDVCYLQSQEIIGIDSLVAKTSGNEAEVTLFDREQNEHPYLVVWQNVTSNFFIHKGLSLMEGNRTFVALDEVVVSESFAHRVLGNQSPVGLTIRIDSKLSNENSIENFRIVNVVKNEISPNTPLADVFFHPEIAPKRVYYVGSYLNGKATLDEVNAQLKKVEWAGNNRIVSCYAQMALGDRTAQLLSFLFVRFLASLILLSGLINFLKFIIQMFYNRQRELGIRHCLGADWKGMFGLLFAEVFWTMSIALFLSCCLSEISIAILNYVVPEKEMPRLLMSEVLPVQCLIYVGTLVFCILVILFPVYKLRKSSVIRPMIKPEGKHVFRYTMIGVQLAISIFFVGGVWAISLFFDGLIGDSYSPLSVKEEKQILSIPVNTQRLRTHWDVILQEIQSLPGYEGYTYLSFENGFQSLSYTYMTYHKNEKEQRTAIVMRGDVKSFEFFHIPMTGKKDIPEGGNRVYVDEQFMHQLQADGNTGTVRLGNTDYQIAGTYRALFKQSNMTKQGNGVGSVFLPSEWKGICYVKFASSADMKDAHAKVEVICRKYVPYTLPLEILPLDKATDERVDTILLMMRCGILLGIVSIILVILSVYSSISIDTVGRQKEIAIRKINGASGKDIASLFAKPYIVVYLLSFVLAYPLLRLILIELTDGHMGVAYRWDWVIGVFLGFAGLLFVVTAQKIYQIMHINPAAIIKKE